MNAGAERKNMTHHVCMGWEPLICHFQSEKGWANISNELSVGAGTTDFGWILMLTDI